MGAQRSGYYSTGQWPAHHRQVAPAPGPFPDTTDSDTAGPEAGRPGIRDAGLGVMTDAFTQVTTHSLFARKAPVRRQPISGPSPFSR